jgi:hypothetical protein
MVLSEEMGRVHPRKPDNSNPIPKNIGFTMKVFVQVS